MKRVVIELYGTDAMLFGNKKGGARVVPPGSGADHGYRRSPDQSDRARDAAMRKTRAAQGRQEQRAQKRARNRTLPYPYYESPTRRA